MFSVTLLTVGKLKEKFYLDAVKEYEKRLCEKLEHEYASLLNRLEGGSYEKEDIEEMKKAISEVTR